MRGQSKGQGVLMGVLLGVPYGTSGLLWALFSLGRLMDVLLGLYCSNLHTFVGVNLDPAELK